MHKPRPLCLHFIGICGKAMGGIAAALVREGWRVSGSDQDVYPPMSTFLHGCGVRILAPYDTRNIPDEVDLVITGKRVAADNPELLHVIRSGIKHCSFPRFLKDHFLHRSRNAVVAGGLGKTTTTAMLAWILQHNKLSPDYLIGGSARNFARSARFSGSDHAVMEGDEYASSFDDRSPKFFHYQPEVAIITNIVEDHPDLYSSFDDLRDAFLTLVGMLPVGGRLIVPDDDDTAVTLGAAAGCEVISTGFGEQAVERITEQRFVEDKTFFRLLNTEFEIPLCGRMNVRNAAMAVLAAAHFDIPPDQSAHALRLFQGVRNRQDQRQIGACILVSDKATHPRSLEGLVDALRQRFPGRRLVSVIQPRATGGRGWVYQRELPEALARFDKVLLLSAHEHRPQQPQPWPEGPFCTDLLASGLRARLADMMVVPTIADIQEAVRRHVRDGDVVVATLLEQSTTLFGAVEAALAARGTVVMNAGVSPGESLAQAG